MELSGVLFMSDAPMAEYQEKCQFIFSYSNDLHGYFCLCEYRRPIILDSWMRRHMRKYFWQRWLNRQGRLHALRRLKAKPFHLKQASGSVGTWRLARSPILQTVLNNARLRR